MRIGKCFLYFMVLLIGGLPVFDALAQEHPEIKSIEVQDRNGTTEIKIISSAPFNYIVDKESDPYQVIVELQNMELGEFREKMIVNKAGVSEIIPMQDRSSSGISKLKIALTVPADVEPEYVDNTLILTFMNPEHAESMNAPGETEEASSVETEERKPFETREYVGEKINIDFQEADLVHIFRLIADISGYNIVVSPEVKGKFSMKLIDVPWDQALDVILRNYGLSKTLDENIIRIAPTAVIAKEEEEIAQAKESQEKSGNLVTKVYAINYANVDEVKRSVETAKILSKRGFISADARTSSVIIKDVEKMHTEFGTIIEALDVPTPQVSIDAKIVEVNTTYSKELGIQWGALAKPNPQSQISGTNLTTANGFFSGNPLLVNLPAAVSPGSGGAIGIGYISAGILRSIDIQLSALESIGKGKVVSSPRVMTMDNQKAKILQGKKIPYETISQEGTQTAFVDAALELTVTPHITPEGTILMNIDTKKNEADFSNVSFNGVPTINTNELSTQVLIKDGDTLALAGILKTIYSKDSTGVPKLRTIPGFGWLFKKEEKTEDSTELMIFITPRIVK
ncbi:MAG: type IV pilus secretin PilQ [Nitrospirae bacterium]|nr:type IV pilus secretin PilQ [Nitrospirota bacterium]